MLHIGVRSSISNLRKFVKFSASASLSLLFRAVCSWLRRRRRHQRAFCRKGGFFCAWTKEGGKRRTKLFTSSKRNLPSYTSCKHVRTYMVHLVIREYPFPPLALEEHPLIFRALLAVSPFFPLPPPLPSRERNTYEGQKAHKTGWGTTGEDGRSIFQKMETGAKFAQLYTVKYFPPHFFAQYSSLFRSKMWQKFFLATFS